MYCFHGWQLKLILKTILFIEAVVVVMSFNNTKTNEKKPLDNGFFELLNTNCLADITKINNLDFVLSWDLQQAALTEPGTADTLDRQLFLKPMV